MDDVSLIDYNNEESAGCFSLISSRAVVGFGTVVLVAAGSFVAGKLWRVLKNMKPQVPPNAHLLTAIKELKEQAAESYSSSPKNEAMLQQLWTLLKPNTLLTGRVTRQWGQIGFQGTDPATDFRSMGVLGLKTILYFSQNHTDNARFLVESMEQTAQLSGAYPFAIACINIANDLIAFLAAHPSVGNEVFCDTAMPPFVRFAELFSIVMMQFDMFHVRFLQQYLRNGGIRELAVMQFNASRRQFFDEHLHTIAISGDTEITSALGRALRLRPGQSSFILD